MITHFKIKNFKSHFQTNLPFSNLNILTGLNGMGKSSVVQALLLLRQTHLKNMLDRGLELKADLCSIGMARDALYQSAEDDLIEFGLETQKTGDWDWSFTVGLGKLDDTFIPANNFENDLKPPPGTGLPPIGLFTDQFQYISAYRNGPVANYDKDTSAVELFRQLSVKEGRCELVAHYLDFFKDEPVAHNSLKKDSLDDDKLLYQVTRWLEDISPDINIRVEKSDSNYRIHYRFSRGKNRTPTHEFRATNIGFGISYALPIIIAALHSPAGSLVIVENPESHIHPEGQAKLMELICRAAKAGVQFIIETHSDHIINGLLVAVKKGIVDPHDSKVYYFDRDIASHATIATPLPILPGGRIKHPPKGFFDRLDKDMEILTGF